MADVITQLTDLEVYEVSLVDKGAIGETFTLIKSEDGEPSNIEKLIRQEDGKWFIYSDVVEKKLGGPFDNMEDAIHRMRQIDVFIQNKDVKKALKQINGEFYLYSEDERNILAGPFSTTEEASVFQEMANRKLEDSKEDLEDRTLGDSFRKSKDDLSVLKNKLENIPDSEFMKIMSSMMQKYHNINSKVNKGGLNNMNQDEIKSLVAEVMGTTMDTVNKNFVAVNKSIDELQKKVCGTMSEEDQKKENLKKEEEAVTKSINVIGEAVKSLAESMTAVTKNLSDVSEKVGKLAESKIEEAVADVSKRLEAIEKQENPSNDASNKEDVNKNSGDGKIPFWKSFAPKTE